MNGKFACLSPVYCLPPKFETKGVTWQLIRKFQFFIARINLVRQIIPVGLTFSRVQFVSL